MDEKKEQEAKDVKPEEKDAETKNGKAPQTKPQLSPEWTLFSR